MRSRLFCILAAVMAGMSLMSASVSSAAAPEKAGEWVPLLQGDKLDGWYILIAGKEKNVDPDRVFTVKDGVVHAYKDAADGAKLPFGGIITEKEYTHYHLRLEFKWGTKKFAPRATWPRDSGIIYHVVGPERIWPQGVECQIQEHDVGDIYAVYSTVTATIDPKTKGDIDSVSKLSSPVFMEVGDGGVPLVQGSVDNVGRVRRSRDWEREGWNTVEVIVQGDRATHIVNGKVNNRCTSLCRPDPNNPQQMLPLAKGKILLQAEGAEVLFRNIEIKLLPENEPAASKP